MAKPLEKPAPTDLYEADFFAWTQDQAAKLRARTHNDVDWDNLAEEIDSVGRSQKREIRHRMGVLLHHLLKWEFQVDRRKKSWRATIREQRRGIREVLADSPSLAKFPAQILDEAFLDGLSEAIEETGLPSSAFPTSCPWSIDQIRDGGFFPGPPWQSEASVRA